MASSVPFGDATVATLQSLNQYSTGLIGGYIIDQVMDSIPIADDNVYGRVARQLLQVALNGVALNFMLKFLHGSTPGIAYRDPSGGYMLLVGLLQGQQSFMKNGKELINAGTYFVKDVLLNRTDIKSPATPPIETP